MPTEKKKAKKPLELALVGDVDDWENDVIKDLLDVKPGRECTLYIDSLGGSVYGSLAVTTLMRRRQLACTGIVLGECSSATLLIFAACQKRFVTPYSTLLFHRMRWESDKRIPAHEASRWARHFEELEKEIDALQARLFGAAEKQIQAWIENGDYVTGSQLADAGLAELFEI
jgi:ATP-dependent protease ClpP protease subunit